MTSQEEADKLLREYRGNYPSVFKAYQMARLTPANSAAKTALGNKESGHEAD